MNGKNFALPALIFGLLGGGCSPADVPADAAAAEPVRAAASAGVGAGSPGATELTPPVPPPAVAPTPAAPAEPPKRIVVSLAERRLWLLQGGDTLLSAPAGIGKGTTLEYEGRSWTFDTPSGERRVLGKEADPVWTPPDWHYVEVARENGFDLHWLESGEFLPVGNSTFLAVQGADVGFLYPDSVGLIDSDPVFEPLPAGEEIIIRGILYVPPIGTRQRRIARELGTHKLDLGNGYLIHGTPEGGTVGQPVSHGCVRLRNEDIAFLFRNVPVGTPVEIR